MKRPRGVMIIGCLLLIQGLLLSGIVVVLAAAIILALNRQLPRELAVSIEGISPLDWASVAANAVVGILSLVGGVALLLVRPWAWTLALLVQGYSLAVDLWSIYQGHTPYLEMLVPIVIIFYLNTRSVSRFFENLRRHTDGQAQSGPATPNALNGLNATAGTITATGGAVVAPSGRTPPDQRTVRQESPQRS